MRSTKSTEKLPEQLAALRQRRINQLRSKIQNGKYKVSNVQIAKALYLAQ